MSPTSSSSPQETDPSDLQEIYNLHALHTALAINRDYRKADQNWENAMKRNRVDQPRCFQDLKESSGGDEVLDPDAVNWKTTANHYHQYPAPEKQSGGLMQKIAGPLILAAEKAQ